MQDPASGQEVSRIHLSYQSGWNRAFVHFNMDDQGVLHLNSA